RSDGRGGGEEDDVDVTGPEELAEFFRLLGSRRFRFVGGDDVDLGAARAERIREGVAGYEGARQERAANPSLEEGLREPLTRELEGFDVGADAVAAHGVGG